MKKWLVYLLGIITGVILTFAFAFYVNLSNNSGIVGLEMFEEPGDYMEYSQFEVFQVVESGCALAHADDSFGAIVFIIPNENQQFYDEQKIVLKKDQCAQRVGTYKYSTKMEIEKTVPAIRIVDGVELPKSNNSASNNKNAGKTLFDKPMTLLVQLYSLFQMKINNFTMNKRLFLKKTNVHNVSERISIVPKWK